MAIPLSYRFYLKCILGALDPKSTTSLFYLECILEALDPANRKEVSRDMHFVMGELGTANHTDTTLPYIGPALASCNCRLARACPLRSD